MSAGLYISNNLSSESYGGSLVGKTNLRLLSIRLDDDIDVISINRNSMLGVKNVTTTKTRLGTAAANCFGLCATLNLKGEAEIYEIAKNVCPKIIWIDSSLFGNLIPKLRIICPASKIISFFHNIEKDIIRSKIINGQWGYYPALVATSINERKSATLSNKIVTIQEEDSLRLKRLYNRFADHILPVSIDYPKKSKISPNIYPNKPYVLFIGSDFPPNIEALSYLRNEIAPYLNKTIILVAGNGLDKYQNQFYHDNLKILGYAEDLESLYFHATAVVAPIFSGGGMKVKVAEALMHGKTVIGSENAFIGYKKAIQNGTCKLASNTEDYIKQIEIATTYPIFTVESYNIFLQEYSFISGATTMNNIINSALES